MRVSDFRVGPGEAAGTVRSSADVAYADGVRETLWFEAADHLEPDLSTAGDPWAVALLPLAVARGEPLEVEAPLDPGLVENLGRVMDVWVRWNRELRPIVITGEDGKAGAAGGRDAAFFSGGVDSFFTLLRDRRELPSADRADIREIITVWGFDIPLARPGAFRRVSIRHARLAASLGVDLVSVATNLRTTRWTESDWATHAHGAGFAGIAHLLGKRYCTVRLAASSGFRDLRPWGSHPHTDPLFSSSSLRLVHDAPEVRRIDKLARIVERPAVLSNLRVCWRSGSDRNCGRCVKCLRTLAALELLGVRPRATSFPPGAWSLEYLETVEVEGPWDIRELRDLQELALESGRTDVHAAIEMALDPGPRPSWWRRIRGAGRPRRT